MRPIVRILLASAFIAAPLSAHAIDVGVSLGGDRGVNANASADVSGGVSADADVSVGGRNGVNADAAARVGGGSGIGADVNATVGGGDGIDTNATAAIGGGGVDANVGLSIGGTNGSGGPGTPGSGPLTPGERDALAAFNAMSDNDRQRLLNRCGQLGTSGGHDADLANLCALLRMAQR